MDCESLGHHVGLPYDPVIPAIEHPLLAKGTIVELGGGDNPYQHVEQQNKVWSETVRFIDKIFSKNPWLKVPSTKIENLTIDETALLLAPTSSDHARAFACRFKTLRIYSYMICILITIAINNK